VGPHKRGGKGAMDPMGIRRKALRELGEEKSASIGCTLFFYSETV